MSMDFNDGLLFSEKDPLINTDFAFCHPIQIQFADTYYVNGRLVF